MKRKNQRYLGEFEDGHITGDKRGDADGGSEEQSHATERLKKTDA